MYNVLLVDDEVSVLNSLQTEFAWHQYGIDTILTASNGMQALEIIRTNQVDLLITDICMPQMDGMTLLSEVRTMNKEIRCVLLTAHGEFEYAKRAIRLGVENYLLKPLQIDELEETIENAINNLYLKRGNTDSLFRDNVLKRWMSGAIGGDELSERTSLLDINIYLPEYLVVCVRKKRRCHLNAYYSVIQGKLFSLCEVQQFWDDDNQMVFVLGGSQLNQEQIAGLYADSAKNLGVGEDIALCIGPTVKGSERANESFKAANNLLKSGINNQPGLQVLVCETQSASENRLLTETILSLFHEQSDEVRASGYLDIAHQLDQRNAKHSIAELGRSLSDLFSKEFPNRSGLHQQFLSRLNLLSTPSAQENFAAALNDLLEYSYLLYRYCFEELSPVVQHAIAYIQIHYSDGLSLKEFCAMQKVNTAYLGFLFRRETGMFFNSYLNQLRICCSIRMLNDSSMKIADIAKAAGFSSPSYFISCFKKQTGLSPIQYRSMRLMDAGMESEWR